MRRRVFEHEIARSPGRRIGRGETVMLDRAGIPYEIELRVRKALHDRARVVCRSKSSAGFQLGRLRTRRRKP